MRRRLLALLIPMLLAGCHGGGSGGVKVGDAWARLSPIPGRAAAGYFTIHGGAKDDRLVKVSSALVGGVELHEAGMEGMMATMKPISGIDVPAGATVKLAPGGTHAMLMGVNPAILPGTAIPLALSFASGKVVEVEAKTVAAGAPAPE